MFPKCLSCATRCSAWSASDLPRQLILIPSSRDDVRTERAAIALSVGRSWPPHKRRRSAGRPSWQQLLERALQEHILHHHELPLGVRSQQPGWWQPGDAIACLFTHEEIAHVSTPAAPAAPAAAVVEDEPSGSGTKRRKTRFDPIMWFFDVMDQWRTQRQWCVRSPPVPWDVRQVSC